MILATLALLAALTPSQLAQQAVIVDTHIDAPSLQVKEWLDIKGMEKRNFSFAGARQGGLDVAFMSVYTSPTNDELGTAEQLADQQIDAMEAMVQRYPKQFAILRDPNDIAKNKGKVLLAFGMENAAPIGDQLSKLRKFADRGVSYITLAHSDNNRLSDSSYAIAKKWNGLSPFGREAVAEMNRLGIMVDVSHLADASALEAIQLSKVPVIATHSAFRHFTPGFERNVSDELAKAIAVKGGVIQVTFGIQFVNPQAAKNTQDYFIALKAFKDRYAKDVASGTKPAQTEAEFDAAWDKDHPIPATGIDAVADHIEYGVKLVGIDHIGIGSDFDGVGESLPTGLRTAADYPNLIAELRKRGFTDAQLRKILGENTIRLWKQVRAAKRA